MIRDEIANSIFLSLGPLAYWVLAFSLAFGLPLLLILACVHLVINGRRKPRWGIALGFGIGVWASLSWLVAPFCGAYLNLPWVMLYWVLLEPDLELRTWRSELFIHAMNLTVWPLLGWLAFLAWRVLSKWE